MIVPLWLPWTVVVTCALAIVLEALVDTAPQGGDPELRGPSRPPLGVGRALVCAALASCTTR